MQTRAELASGKLRIHPSGRRQAIFATPGILWIDLRFAMPRKLYFIASCRDRMVFALVGRCGPAVGRVPSDAALVAKRGVWDRSAVGAHRIGRGTEANRAKEGGAKALR